MKKAPSRISRLLFLLLLAALLAGPFGGGLVSVARAQVQLNLGNVDIQVFVKLISRLTGKTFIADDRVKGRVTVFSPREVTAEEAYRIFLGVLEVMGYSTLQTSRGVIKIIPSEEASRSNPPTFFARRPKNRPENFQTRVIPLKHLKVEDVEPMVGAMISSVGQLIVFRRNNSMVVSDYLTNIDRILEVLAVFDRQGLGDRVEVIPLRHSPVEAIAKVLREIRPDVLSAAAPAAGVRPPRGRRRRRVPRPRRPLRPLAGGRGIIGDKSPVTIVADERINAIILMGPRARIEEMKRLIATLDVPSTSLQKNLYVHPLKNASAEELLPVLRELIAGASQGAAERRQGGERRRDRRRRRAGEGTETERLETGFLGEVNVVADKGTNTLVITATQRDYEALKPVIEKLDIKRRQVHIEAIIAEITVTKARELGFDFQSARNVEGGLLIGRSSTSSNLPSLVPSGSEAAGSVNSFFSLTGLAALAVSGETVVTPSGARIPAHLLLFRAIESDSDIDILSRPSILTRDNQEAEIVVGSNVPFIVSQQADRTDPNSVFSQIERRDIGVILRITPQVSEGDYIKLDIFQEISAIQENPPNLDVNTQGLVLRKRSARTSIVVKDRQLIAIGGLISDDASGTRSRVPFLSRIPILGRLFRFDTQRGEKTNLLILLTPRVLREKEDILAERTPDSQEILFPPVGPVTSLQTGP